MERNVFTVLGAYGFLILSQVMVGTNIVGAKYLVDILPLLFLLTARFFLATLFLMPLHWLANRRKIPIGRYFSQLNRRDWTLVFTQAICAGVLFNFFMVWGLRYSNANEAGIITSTLPAIIAIACWLFLKEKFTFKKSMCVALSTLGLVVISAYQLRSDSPHSSILGNLLVFIALLPEACYYVLTKLQSNRLPIFLMSATINAINAIILIPLLCFYVNWHTIHFSAFDFLILAIISMASGLFYVFWYLGADKVDAVMASLATAAMPISTVIIAWLALGETISFAQLAGMGLVISAIVAYAI